jgi:CPA2 family monovalent cation:H+ antiporter-2
MLATVRSEGLPELIALALLKSMPMYFGDASRAELLSKVHAAHASAIVLTMDHAASAPSVTSVVHREYSRLPLFVARAKKTMR